MNLEWFPILSDGMNPFSTFLNTCLLSFVGTSLSHSYHVKTEVLLNSKCQQSIISLQNWYFWQNYTTWSCFTFFYKKLTYVERSYILYKNYSWSSSFDNLPYVFICLYIFTRKEDELSLLNTKKTKISS